MGFSVLRFRGSVGVMSWGLLVLFPFLFLSPPSFLEISSSGGNSALWCARKSRRTAMVESVDIVIVEWRV